MTQAAFNQIDQEKLVDLAENQLLSSILEGRAVQGSRLVEAEVARQMGISRAPLREAVRKLESRGLLVNVPRKGVFVRSYSTEDIDQVAQLRLCIEQFAVEYLARNQSPVLSKKLVMLESDYSTSFSGRVSRKIIEANLRFHLSLVELVGNPRLSSVFENVANELRLIHSLTGAATDWDFLNPSTYSKLVQSIRRGDAVSAREEIGRLIEGFRRKGHEKSTEAASARSGGRTS